MNERTAGKEKRQKDEAAFLCEILDDLVNLSDVIKTHPNTVKEMSAGDIAIDELIPPPSLPLPKHEYGQPAELSFSAISNNNSTAIETLSIVLNESSPIEIVNDGGLARIYDGNIVTHDELTALHDGLLTILPPAYRADPVSLEAVVEYARRRAPQIQEVSTFKWEDDELETQVTIQLTEIETTTDTMRSLDISILRPHASSKRVGTRLILSEPLLRRVNNQLASDAVERSLAIEAINDDGINTLLLHDIFLKADDIKVTVPINLATRHHMADILDALATLTAA